MPFGNRKRTSTLNSSTQRKVRQLETNIINQIFNDSLTCNNISDILSNDPSTSQVNVSHISMNNASISSQLSIDENEIVDANNLSNGSDPEEINSTSSSDTFISSQLSIDQNEIDANDLLNDNDPEEINPASSSEEENNECLPLFEEEFFSNDEDEDNDTKKNDFKIFLASWAVEENISQTSLRSLLRGIKKYTCDKCHCNIPSDPRTLLGTPRITDVKNCAGGEYYHFSLLKSIENSFSFLPKNLNNIKICINIDGLPLSKSSQQQLWPILGSVTQSKQVFIIGAYYGRQKPSNSQDFLREFIEETKLLCHNGIVIDNKHIQCSIDSIICDTPAKSFILQVKGHTGYSSCTKCITEGDFRSNKVCFPQINAPLRTDLDFRLKTDENFHIGTSIIEKIPNFDLINNIPLDYMHLVCLGVTRRLLYLWLFGDKQFCLENRKCQSISSNLEDILKVNVPCEFARKPRSLTYVKLWKATEYRELLLYTGFIAFKNFLCSDIYDHFVTLHVAIRILCSNNSDLFNYCQELLEHFVTSFALIYGKHNVSHNVHGLVHLVKDAKKFGSLDNFSAFKYENFLQTLKKLLKKHDKPLQQIVKRYIEYEKNKVTEKLMTEEIEHFIVDLKSIHSFGPLIHGCSNPQYKIIRKTNMTLRTDVEADNCCALIDGTIVLIKNIAYNKDLNVHVIIGHKFLYKENFYNIPCPSSLLKIFSVHSLGQLQMWPIENIDTKYVKLPFSINKYVVLPLLH